MLINRNDGTSRPVQLFSNGTAVEYYADVQKIRVTSFEEAFRDLPQLRYVDMAQSADVSGVGSYFRAFQNDVNFNAPINVGSGAYNCAKMLAGCSSFNAPVTFDSGITGELSCANMMNGCASFDQPVNLPDSVTNIAGVFAGCASLTGGVTVGNNVTNMDDAFRGCTNFIGDISVPDSVINARNAFRDCTNLQNGHFGSGLVNMAYMYANCGSLTSIQGQPNSADMLNAAAYQNRRKTNMAYALAGTGAMQSLGVVIPYSVYDAGSVMDGSAAVGGGVTIQARIATNAMAECVGWSGTVEIGSLTQNMERLLYNARAFNSTLAVPYNARQCGNMIRNCRNFNAPILLNGGDNYDNAFRDCVNFNQNVIFPPRFINMQYGNMRDDGVYVLLNRSLKNAFRGCDAMKGTIYFPGNGDYTVNDGGVFFRSHDWLKSDGNPIDATLCYYNVEARMPVVNYESGTVSIVPKSTVVVDTLANTIAEVRSGNRAAEDEIVRRLTMGEDAEYDQGTINTGAITVDDLKNAI